MTEEGRAPSTSGTTKETSVPFSNGLINSTHRTEMAHEAGGGAGAESSPLQTPSPPLNARAPLADASFQQQILQNTSPRKSHIAERAKHSLENNFLLQLKKQQQLQQEILLQHFQQQRQQLAEQHEQQLRHHLKLWEQQKALEEAALREAREAREARERQERVEMMRKKDKHCANASTQVKQKLQEFLKKKQAAASANGTVPSSPYRNWGLVKSGSGESVGGCHPYRLPPPPLSALLQPAHDYPLRKTASEPNMLKVRLKARVMERRASPLARPTHKARIRTRNGSSGCVSPRVSPPRSASIQEEEEPPRPPPELLFSSPSLPNISLHQAMPPRALPPLEEAPPPRAPQRPLGRTHSAPLPLPEPTHLALREQIRKTVLTRAADAASLKEEESEVMDLTRRPAPHALARALSSPLVPARSPPTGLAYDPIMLKHGCACGSPPPTHWEHSGRLQSIWARLCETGLASAAERTRPRKATLEELHSVHTEAHVALFAGRRALPGGAGLVRLACGGTGADADTAWHETASAPAARTAVGALVDLALRTARGELRNGFAVIRPPGHHAEPNQAMGFCFFNNVAIAAKQLKLRLGLTRILIVDWDVHHGNGTQAAFYNDPHVLYMSLHRHDDGNFFPGTGAASECGSGAGTGFTVNVAFGGGLQPPLGDAEYLAAFRTVIMPIAKEYDPQVVLVSCGFDAARGHAPPLGGYEVSAECFAHLTQELMTLAHGKVVLSLEGGYALDAVCDCAGAVVSALLGLKPRPVSSAEIMRPPAASCVRALQQTIAALRPHWPVLGRMGRTLGLSAAETGLDSVRMERDALATAEAMAGLSVTRAMHPALEPMEQDDQK